MKLYYLNIFYYKKDVYNKLIQDVVGGHINTSIKEMISMLLISDILDAGEKLLNNNPLSLALVLV